MTQRPSRVDSHKRGSSVPVLAVLLFGGLISGGLGCGGNPTPSATPRRVEAAPSGTLASPGSVRVTPQPTPEGLFLVARLRRIQETSSKVARWCSLPFDLDDALHASGDEVIQQLRLDLPVDLAVSLAAPRDANEEEEYAPEYQSAPDGGMVYDVAKKTSEVNGVLSVAVADPAALVKAFEGAGKLVEADESGEYIVEVAPDLHCLLGPSLGESSHRLACAPWREDLDALGRFANTTLTTRVFPDKPVFVELRFEPLRARYGNDIRQLRGALPGLLEEMRLDSERFDRALQQASHALVDEVVAWSEGLDSWDFALEIDARRDVMLGESTLRFRKNDSYLAGALERSAAENAPVPALFWDLPQEVDAASFSRRLVVADADRRLAEAVAELLAGGLEYAGVASGVLDSWVKSFRSLLESPGTAVIATGSVPPAQTTKPKVTGPFDEFGYYLVGVEDDDGAYAAAWRSSVLTFNDKRFRAELSSKLGDDFPKLPSIRSRKLPAKKGQPVIELFDLSFPLPKSELTGPAKANKLAFHLAMAVVGKRTWFGMGLSERDATYPVALLCSGRAYPTLATREGLRTLHEGNVHQASFATLESYSKWLGGVPLSPDSVALGGTLRNAMPHRGLSPMLFRFTTSAQGPSLTAHLEVPREAFEDGSALFVAIAAAYASAFGGFGDLSPED